MATEKQIEYIKKLAKMQKSAIAMRLDNNSISLVCNNPEILEKIATGIYQAFEENFSEEIDTKEASKLIDNLNKTAYLFEFFAKLNGLTINAGRAKTITETEIVKWAELLNGVIGSDELIAGYQIFPIGKVFMMVHKDEIEYNTRFVAL